MAKREGGAVSLAELMAKKARPDEEEEDDEDDDDEEQGQGDEPALEAELQAIDAVQGELAVLDDRMADEVLQVTRKYSQLKKPVYGKRQDAISGVPEFWFRVLLAHESIGANISDLDQGPLRHLTRLEVVDVEGTQQDYRVDFHFSENPYFGNAVLWKQFEFGPEEARVMASAVEWKDTPEAQELQATLVPNLMQQNVYDVQPSFFSIFHPEDRDFQLGDTLKNEVWVNPLAVYMSADFEEEEEGEGEEEEGGDDGDDGGEEEEEGGDEGGKEQEG